MERVVKMDVIEMLEQRQKAEGGTHRQFAAKLGLTEGMWSRLRAGERNIGPKTLRRIARVYPDLVDAAVGTMLDERAS
jgi:transcriptional regulator with XRE-family HTH domain